MILNFRFDLPPLRRQPKAKTKAVCLETWGTKKETISSSFSSPVDFNWISSDNKFSLLATKIDNQCLSIIISHILRLFQLSTKLHNFHKAQLKHWLIIIKLFSHFPSFPSSEKLNNVEEENFPSFREQNNFFLRGAAGKESSEIGDCVGEKKLDEVILVRRVCAVCESFKTSRGLYRVIQFSCTHRNWFGQKSVQLNWS